LDLLNERGREVLRLADVNNKKAIESQLAEINSEWRELVSGLEGRRNALEALSRHWEDLEAQWALIETRLSAIEEKSKLIDTVVRSKQHLQDTVKALEVRIKYLTRSKSILLINRKELITRMIYEHQTGDHILLIQIDKISNEVLNVKLI